MAPDAPRQEEAIYSGNGVVITIKRVVFLSRTYSTANITSVAVRSTIGPAPKLGAIILIVLGLLVGAFGGLPPVDSLPEVFGPNATDSYSQLQAGALVGFVGLALILTGLLWIHRLKEGHLHHVFIGSASGEAEALASPDRESIHSPAEAISRAIAFAPVDSKAGVATTADNRIGLPRTDQTRLRRKATILNVPSLPDWGHVRRV